MTSKSRSNALPIAACLLLACGAEGTEASTDHTEQSDATTDASGAHDGGADGSETGQGPGQGTEGASDSSSDATAEGSTSRADSGTTDGGTSIADTTDASTEGESSGGVDQGCGDRYTVLGTFEAGEPIPTQGSDVELESGQSFCYELSFADAVSFSMIPFSGHPFALYQASSGFLNFRVTTLEGAPITSHNAIQHVEVDDLPLPAGTYVIEIFGADLGLGMSHLRGHSLALGTVSPSSEPYVDLGSFEAGETIPVLRGGVIVASPSTARTFRLVLTDEAYLSGQLTLSTLGFPDLDIEALTNVGDSIHVWSGSSRSVSFQAERVSPGVFEITVEPVSNSAHHTTEDSIDAWQLELSSVPAN